MRKVYLLVSLLFATLAYCEPSAFDGAALDSTTNTPQNAQAATHNAKNTQSLGDVKSSIEGLQSLVAGQSEQLGILQQEFKTNITSDNTGSLRDLNKRFEENLKVQNENFDKIGAALGQLAQLIDAISENYVTKEQLKLNMGKNYKELKNTQKKAADNNITTKKQAQAPEPKTESTPQTAMTDAANKNLDDIYNGAIKEYKANNIDKSKQLFEELERENYPKKAVVEYYLGEIAYKKGDYRGAIEYYQKSIEADEKTTFVPMILYHTAYSLEQLGDKASAKKILQNLIANYPNNYLIPSAKKRLAELK